MIFPKIGVIQLLLKYYKFDDIATVSSSTALSNTYLPENVFNFDDKSNFFVTDTGINNFFMFSLKWKKTATL